MPRMRPFEYRCPECHMLRELCICDAIRECRQQLQVRTRVVILMHYRELRRTTNTARLARLVLDDCEIRVRGLRGSIMSTDGILEEGRQSLLLYPTAEAVELTPGLAEGFGKPVTLIVPDGSWGQAAKVAKREEFLRDVPKVKLQPDQVSRYGLRRGLKPEGLATFEAIAQSLGVLESPAIQQKLEALFEIMVTRTLRSRGIRRQEPDLASEGV